MTNIAMSVEGLSKQYHIGDRQKGYKTLRDQISDAFVAPWRRLSSVLRGGTTHLTNEAIWALKDVTFDVKQGEVVGIVGRNGAGKSTLLKVLSRITEPTKGRAQINGRVASLLEVGTGFHPELTGRENIYLNGAILGMRRVEIEQKFDEIIAFAEIEKFIDTPVKHYSSGMYLRLAFAVAAHLEPEILLVDEVLAVGDASFQKKCMGKMGGVAQQGRTVFLVSHNMAAITHLCDWVLWMDNGQLIDYGNTEEIVSKYLGSGVSELGEVTLPQNPERITDNTYVCPLAVRIRDNEGRVTSAVDSRHSFNIEVEYQILKRISNLRIGIRLTAPDGAVVFAPKDTDSYEEGMERLPGRYVSKCTVPGDFLNYGQYFVTIGSDVPMIRTHFLHDRVLAFHVEQTGGVGGHMPDRRGGLLRLRLPWNIEKIG
jgi:lipopolysaccharide transport system ATP-binding protein